MVNVLGAGGGVGAATGVAGAKAGTVMMGGADVVPSPPQPTSMVTIKDTARALTLNLIWNPIFQRMSLAAYTHATKGEYHLAARIAWK